MFYMIQNEFQTIMLIIVK